MSTTPAELTSVRRTLDGLTDIVTALTELESQLTILTAAGVKFTESDINAVRSVYRAILRTLQLHLQVNLVGPLGSVFDSRSAL